MTLIIILGLLSIIWYLLFQKHYDLVTVPSKEPYSIFVSNITELDKLVVLFGKYAYINAENYGSDTGAFVNPISQKYNYLELLDLSDKNPCSVFLIRLKANNPAQLTKTINYNTNNVYGQFLKGASLDAFLSDIDGDEVDIHCKNKNISIDGDSHFYFHLMPKTEMEMYFYFFTQVYQQTSYYEKIKTYLTHQYEQIFSK